MRPASTLLGGCILLAYLTAPVSVTARVWHVPADAPTIQAGIDSSRMGDVVEIACGTYYEYGILLRRGITIRSETGESGCVTIDAQQQGRVLLADNLDVEVFIVGLDILNGRISQQPWPHHFGGGLYVHGSDVTIEKCLFSGNASRGGGAIHCRDRSSVIMSQSVLRQNTAYNGSGGAFEFDREVLAVVTDCVFEDNRCSQGEGGAIACGSSGSMATFERCIITGNTAYHASGGGIAAGGGELMIADCIITDNFAEGGGGISITSRNPTTVETCIIARNSATGAGGISILYDSPTRISNCTICDNVALAGYAGAAGIANYTYWVEVLIERTVVAHNSEGGAYWGTGRVDIRCCNFYDENGEDWTPLIANQAHSNGNFSADPLFCDLANGNYKLRYDSPCRAGNQPDGYDCGLIGALDTGCYVEETVEIDIEPRQDENRINCREHHGIVKVAILTTESFDALSVDHTTVRFGPADASEAHVNAHGPVRREKDCDRDGDSDLLLHFRFNETGIQCGDTEAVLVGETYDGQPIRGSDHILTRGPDKAGSSDYVEANAAEVRPLALLKNSPNPFNPMTSIAFSVDRLREARIDVYDLSGYRVAVLADGAYEAGRYEVTWPGIDSHGQAVASGTYIVRLEAEGIVDSRKIMLVR